jgi:peptidoglycan/LPS O-acetylase OafA/YrhL
MVQTWWPGAPQSFDGPAWSMSIEILLYVLFFFGCRLGLRAGWMALAVALIGAALFLIEERFARGVNGFFMGGAIVALWGWLRVRADAAAIARGIGVVCLAGWVALYILLYRDTPWLGGGEHNVVFLLVFDLILCPLTVLALALREQVRGGSSAWLGFLGDISYSTYLLHFPVQLALALVAARLALAPAFFMQGWVMIAFYAVLIALGAASYRWFERRAQDWIRGRKANVAVAAE